MKVLHVYDEGDPQVARYVEMLRQSMEPSVVMQTAVAARTFRQQLESFQPDIVHQHGSVRFALPGGLRLVVSPHGHSLGAVPRVWVAIARSAFEQDAIADVCPRIVLILNPLVTRTTTAAKCAEQTLAVYRRVMHTHVLPLLDNQACKTLSACLSAAIHGDSRWVSDSYTKETRDLSADSLTLLRIYARNEGVADLLEEGLRLLDVSAGLSLQDRASDAFDGFLPDGYACPQPAMTTDPIGLAADIRSNGVSLLRLAELHRSLLDDNLDEAKLLSRLEQEGLAPTFAATIKILGEQTLLTEGFMPLAPEESRLTQQLRSQLASRQSIV